MMGDNHLGDGPKNVSDSTQTGEFRELVPHMDVMNPTPPIEVGVNDTSKSKDGCCNLIKPVLRRSNHAKSKIQKVSQVKESDSPPPLSDGGYIHRQKDYDIDTISLKKLIELSEAKEYDANNHFVYDEDDYQHYPSYSEEEDDDEVDNSRHDIAYVMNLFSSLTDDVDKRKVAELIAAVFSFVDSKSWKGGLATIIQLLISYSRDVEVNFSMAYKNVKDGFIKCCKSIGLNLKRLVSQYGGTHIVSLLNFFGIYYGKNSEISVTEQVKDDEKSFWEKVKENFYDVSINLQTGKGKLILAVVSYFTIRVFGTIQCGIMPVHAFLSYFREVQSSFRNDDIDLMTIVFESVIYYLEVGYNFFTGSDSPPVHGSDVHEFFAEDNQIELDENAALDHQQEGVTQRANDYIRRVKDHIERGYKIARMHKGQKKYALIQNRISKQVLRLKRVSACIRNEMTRDVPLGILTEGTTGVGKSFLNEVIVRTFHAVVRPGIDFDTSMQYSVPDASYWNGFRSQPYLLMDEMGSKHKGQQDDRDTVLLNVINNAPYIPDQAAIEDKGMYPCLAELVLCSSNFKDMNVKDKMRYPSATLRRLPLRLNVAVQPEFRIDPTSEKSSLSTAKLEEYKRINDGSHAWPYLITAYRVYPNSIRPQSVEYENLGEFRTENEFCRFLGQFIVSHRQKISMSRGAANELNERRCYHGLRESQCMDCAKDVEVQYQAADIDFEPWDLDGMEEDDEEIEESYYLRFKEFIIWLVDTIKCMIVLVVLNFSLPSTIARHISALGIFYSSIREGKGIMRAINASTVDMYGKRTRPVIDLFKDVAKIVIAVKVAKFIYDRNKKWREHFREKVMQNLNNNAPVQDSRMKNIEVVPSIEVTEQAKIPTEREAKKMPFDIERTPWDYSSIKVTPLPMNFAGSGMKPEVLASYLETQTYHFVTNKKRATMVGIKDNLYITSYHVIAPLNEKGVREKAPEEFHIAVSANPMVYSEGDKGSRPDTGVYNATITQWIHIAEDTIMFNFPHLPPCKDLSKYFVDSHTMGDMTMQLVLPRLITPRFVGQRENIIQYKSKIRIGEPIHKNAAGQSGALYIGLFGENTPCIWGQHLGQDKNTYESIIIKVSREQIFEGCFKLKKLHNNISPVVQCAYTQTDTALGVMPHSRLIYSRKSNVIYHGQHVNGKGGASLKSKIIPTPFKNMVEKKFGESKYGVPKFGYVNHANGLQYSAYSHNFEGRADFKPNFPEGLLKKAVDNYNQRFDNLKYLFKECLHPVPDKVVLNGQAGIPFIDAINKNTSAGHPFNRSKAHLFDILEDGYSVRLKEANQQEYDLHMKLLREGRPIDYCGRASEKDEAMKKEKIEIRKNRIFIGSNIYKTMFDRKFFLTPIRFLQSHMLQAEMAVGINVQSDQWDSLYEYLHIIDDGNYINGDYSGFDLRMSPQIILAAYGILIGWCEESGNYDDCDIECMWRLAMMTAFPKVSFNGELFRFIGSNPSGHPLTIIINCIANSLYNRMAFYNFHPNLNFNAHVSLITYGDDDLSSVSNTAHKFTQISKAEYLRKYGVIYTDPQKNISSRKYMKFYETDFLKRKWAWNATYKRHFCPIDKETIHKMLCFRRRSEVLPAATHYYEIINNVLRESALHGGAFFYTILELVKEIAQQHPDIVTLSGMCVDYDEWIKHIYKL